MLLPQIFIAALFPLYKADRKSKTLFVKPGSVVKKPLESQFLLQKVPAAAPPSRAGPGLARSRR